MSRYCEQCGRQRPVMVVMEPGNDGKPWELCSSCYLDGLRPMDWGVKKPAPPVVEVSPEMAAALQKSGWKVASEEETKKRGTVKPKRGKKTA